MNSITESAATANAKLVFGDNLIHLQFCSTPADTRNILLGDGAQLAMTMLNFSERFSIATGFCVP